jgi:hypothetical protein
MTSSVPRATNLAVRFVLELCMLAGLAFVGFQLATSIAIQISLAIALPLAAAVLWGVAIAPKARRRAPDPGRAALELALFAAATIGLVIAGQPMLGLVLAGAAIVNVGLMFAWGQRQTA